MTFLDRWAMAWLRSHGFSVFRISDDDSGALSQALTDVVAAGCGEQAARALRGRGYTVYAPGAAPIPPPLTVADARAALESQKFTVLEPGEEPLYGLDRATAALKKAGYKVFPPEQPPEIGWWDAQPPAKPEDHPSRDVLSVLNDTVNYAIGALVHSCKVHTFHGWRRVAHAAHRAPACEHELPPDDVA